MKNIRATGVEFEILEEKDKILYWWSKMTGHLVFDVKMDIYHKERHVLDVHKTPYPLGSTRTGMVSIENIRIALTCTILNGLEVFVADIRNAYLQDPSS